MQGEQNKGNVTLQQKLVQKLPLRITMFNYTFSFGFFEYILLILGMQQSCGTSNKNAIQSKSVCGTETR